MAQDGDKPENVSDSKRIHIRVNGKVYDDLRMLAEFEGRTVSDIVRHVIFIHLRDSESLAKMKKEQEEKEEKDRGVQE